MTRTLISLIALCILNNPVSAYLSAGNQRLDHAIWPAHAQKLIVAGEIKEIRLGPALGFELERQVEIGFNVTGVILGDRKYGMRLLDIDLSHFDWPQDLVKFEKAARCILVLRRDEEDGKEQCSVVAVVPAHRRSLKRVEDGEQAKRVLEEEILAELKMEKSPARQTALLIQVAPILSEKHAEPVAPFATSKNQWVKRAALAALIYATEDKEYIRLAAKDVQAYLSTTDENDLIDGTFAPYPYFLNHYFFLEKQSWTFGSRWDEKEAEKHLRILNTMLKLNIVDENVANTLKRLQ